ncbi:unnamed protein product [Adineta steineri]|uniref:L-ornithine N(5)-oxygenase n=1 Tax=Adineta steineri TaxID=433720 RepID=A0A816ASC7_9BILA|nr:unnamed protein product [Adineta steineri]CAF1601279.1 unnamed protein product [Adineta steineri]
MDCVIDASGTYGCPNFAGPGKLPAISERTLRMTASPVISYRIPNERDEYLAGKRILLIGKGHSAATSAVFLGQLKKRYPETQLFWVIKQSVDHLPYCSNPNDPLEQRRHLADEANRIYADGVTFNEIYTNTVVTQFIPIASSTAVDVTLEASSSRLLRNIDYVIVNTGLQPDRSLYANMNVHECPLTKGPIALAAKLLSSIGNDCLQQISHGANSLMTTENNFFIVGNKSYGTHTNFLMKIGFEQVDLVFQLINASRKVSMDVTENCSPVHGT